MSVEFDIYGPVLKLLNERLEMKHEQYGTSYLGRDFEWLHKRMMVEVDELSAELFSIHLSGHGTIREALDVAICALLIADKKRRKQNMITMFEDPAPF